MTIALRVQHYKSRETCNCLLELHGTPPEVACQLLEVLVVDLPVPQVHRGDVEAGRCQQGPSVSHLQPTQRHACILEGLEGVAPLKRAHIAPPELGRPWKLLPAGLASLAHLWLPFIMTKQPDMLPIYLCQGGHPL